MLLAFSSALAAGGDVDGLRFAVDPTSATVTGHFESRTGEQFSCIFALRGTLHNGIAVVTTAYPGDSTVISGLLVLGPTAVSLSLLTEPGGCANVEPFARGPVTLGPITPNAWTEVRVISAEKEPLRPKPGAPATRPYVVKGDVVGVLSTQGEWWEVQFTGADGAAHTGWIAAHALFPLP